MNLPQLFAHLTKSKARLLNGGISVVGGGGNGRRLGSFRLFACLALLSLAFATTVVAQSVNTTTTLSGVPPSNSQTLVATVRDSSNNVVTLGSVTFYDGSRVLATLQLVRNGSKGFTPGTATLKTILGSGSHAIRAVYNGTSKTYRSSSSAVSSISPSGGYRESVSLAAAGGPGNYTLTTTVSVSGAGLQAPTGTVNFFDQTLFPNSLLGSSLLGNTIVSPTGFLNPSGTANFNKPFARIIKTGDFNNDGYLDLAIVTAEDLNGFIQIMLGNGDGTFTHKQTAQVRNSSQSVVMWDFNGDGVLDLAAANTVPCGNGYSPCGYISMLTGNGDGTFQVNTQALFSGSNPRGLAVGDLTGDGIPDLLVANSGGYLNECNTTNNNPNNPPKRYLDHTVSYYFANSDGSFQSQRTVTIVYPNTNQNRCQHVGESGLFGILLGGYINLSDQNRSNPFSLAVGDFEGTGNLNVAVADNGYERVFMLRNDGNGNLSLLDPSLYFWTIGARPTAIESADFNKDGVPDLVIINAVSNTVDVFLGCSPRNSCGSPTSQLFPTKLQYRPGTSYQRGQNSNSLNVTLPDINNDGNLDIVVQNENEFSISVFLGNGAGAFSGAYNFPAGNYPVGLASGDFNGDGLHDVVTSSSENPSKASVLLNSTGSMTATASIFNINVFALGNPQHSVRAGYGLNADGSGTGNTNYNPLYTNTVTLAGSLVPTSITLNTNRPSGVVAARESVTLTANVTPPSAGSIVPGGTITFYDGGASLGSVVVSGATASLTTTYNTSQIGTRNLSAVYSGDANFAASSVGRTLAVNAYVPVGTSVAVGSDPNGNGPCTPPNNIAPTCVFNGQTPVQINATVNTTTTTLSGNTLTGSVTFYDGACNTGTKLGTGLLGTTFVSGSNASASASVSAAFATVGTHNLCAVYSGDTNFASGSGTQGLPVSQFITSTVTTLAVTPSGAVVAPGTVLTLAAVVRDASNNPVNPGLVIFYDAAREVGRAQLLSGGTASVKVRLPMGPRSLTASFQPRSGAVGTTFYGGSTSAAQAITVKPSSGVPSLVSLLASATSPYTLTANLSASGVTPFSGSLSFLDQTANNFALGSAAVGSSTVNLRLNPPSVTPVDASPSAVAGDFNNDGYTDMVIASAASNTIRINLGQADGSFNTSPTFAVCNPKGMAVADFDSDGHSDLAIVSAGLTCPTTIINKFVVVFRGNGDGTFIHKATLTAVRTIQPYRQSIAVGDLNGDGKPDLVAANQASASTESTANSIGRWLGNGDGTFGAESTYILYNNATPGPKPTVLAVVDYNGDGYLDVVAADSQGGRLQAMIGDGSGALTVRFISFGNPKDISTRMNNCCNFDNLQALEVGDLNGDGLLDYTVLNVRASEVNVYITNSDRTFGTRTTFAVSPVDFSPGPNYRYTPSGMFLADVNGDTINDLLITNVNANPCQSSGACATGQSVTASYFYDATNISLLLGTRAGSFGTLTVLPGSLLNVPTNNYNGHTYTNQYGYVSGITGDFDGDGFTDMAALNNIPPNTPDTEVIISGTTGNSTAKASATITNGAVSAINITNAGFYSQEIPVDCRIFSKTGSGATCSCYMSVQPPFNFIPQPVAIVGGGTLPASGAYNVLISYWNQNGETQASKSSYELGLTTGKYYTVLTAPGRIEVPAPPAALGASGYYIYLQNNFQNVAKVKITGFGNGVVTAFNTVDSPPKPSYVSNGTFNNRVTGCVVTNGGSNYSATTVGPSLYVFNGNPTVTASAQVSGIAPNGGGSHNVIARYPGDTNYSTDDSDAVSLTGNKISVAAALGVTGASNTAGAIKTLTASVSPSSAFGFNAAGTVTFFDGATQIGAPQPLTNGSAAINTAPLNAGPHSFTAIYSGDANFLSASAGSSGIITPNATGTTISATPATSTAGQSVTVTVAVAPSASGALNAGGTVTFYDSGAQIGTPQPLSNGQAQLTIATLGGGAHSLSATYSGDGSFQGSQTAAPANITVNKVATTLAVSANPTAPTMGQAVTLRATLSPATSNSLTADGSVIFTDGTETVGVVELADGKWELTLPAVTAGTHIFKALYKGNAYFEESNSSNTISFTFSKVSTALTLKATPSQVRAGESTKLTAVLNPSSSGDLYTTGKVTFKDGATQIGEIELSAGPAEVSIAALSGGVHNFSAVYEGDNNFVGSEGPLALSGMVAPTFAKSFAAQSIPLNGTVGLTYTITNPNAGASLSGIGFTDPLPAGLVNATPNGVTGNCGSGTITATQDTGTITLAGGTLNAGSTCTFTVNVTGQTAGTKNIPANAVTSTEGGDSQTASASIIVVAPPAISKTFGEYDQATEKASLTFIVTNPSLNAVSLSGVEFNDPLPAGLVVAAPNELSGSCGGGVITAVPGSNSVSLSGATLAANAACTFSVTVEATVSGSFANTTEPVKSTNGGNGNTASANLITCEADPVVTSTEDSGPNTLRNVIANICAAPKNNITFNLGAGAHTITLNSELLIAKNVNINNFISLTNGSLTISGNNLGRVFMISNTATSVNISNLTVSGGKVTGENGAGLLNTGTGVVTINNSLFTANTSVNGGGSVASSGGTINLVNSTLSGNIATHGAGIFNYGGIVNVLNSTIYNNKANGDTGAGADNANSTGGGVRLFAGTLNIRNSIVAGNTAATNANIEGAVTGQSHNLLSGDPQLAPLADNGGATHTHALLQNSPALDAGTNCVLTLNGCGDFNEALTNDQRGPGAPRKIGTAVDLGAFERNITFDQIAALPDGAATVPYNQTLTATRQLAAGGTSVANAAFSIISIAGQGLPPGLSIASNGTLSGTPSAPGTYTFTVKATDTDGMAAAQQFTLKIDIAPAAISGMATSNGNALAGVLLTLTRPDNMTATAITGAIGQYSFDSLPSGSYTVTPSKTNYSFTPASQSVTLSGADATSVNFAATSTLVPNPQPAGGAVVISEFRLRGPVPISPLPNDATGERDEFIELYNNTDAPVDISGYQLDTSAGFNITVPSNTSIPARGHFLIANADGYSLTASAAPNLTYSGFDLPISAGLALLDASNQMVDGAGFTGTPAPYFEGTVRASVNGGGEHSFARKLNTGTPQDTGDNAADFVLVATDPAASIDNSGLGAPGPENSTSPIQLNARIKASLVDPTAASNAPPNRVRSAVGANPQTAAYGTLDIRRKFTNTTGAPVTALRFRVVDITTRTGAGAPSAGTADLRLLTSVDTSANDGTITIKGTMLDAPAQADGGGLNTSVMVMLPGGTLASGASVNVRFLLGVQQQGNFRFFVNVEALTGDAPGAGKAAGVGKQK